MYFVLPYHNNRRLLQAIFILYLLFYEVIQSKFFLVGKFDTCQENGSRYLWRKRTGWRWWRGKRSKGGRNRKGWGVEKIIESCFVFAGVVLTASSAIIIHSTGRLLLSFSRYCVESAYGGDSGGTPRRGLLPPLWQDRRSSRGSSRPLSLSFSCSLTHGNLSEIQNLWQKRKRKTHTPHTNAPCSSYNESVYSESSFCVTFVHEISAVLSAIMVIKVRE